MTRLFCLCLSLLVLSGCGGLRSPAPRVYTLNAPIAAASTVPASSARLRVLMPQAAPGLDTQQIALRQSNNRISYYSDVQWAVPMNAMVQSLLVESLDARRALQGVSNDLVDINPDYALQVEIRDFQIEKRQSNTVVNVRFLARVVGLDDTKIIMTREYRAAEPVGDMTMNNIMAAFDRAYQTTSTQLVNDTVSTIRARKK